MNEILQILTMLKFTLTNFHPSAMLNELKLPRCSIQSTVKTPAWLHQRSMASYHSSFINFEEQQQLLKQLIEAKKEFSFFPFLKNNLSNMLQSILHHGYQLPLSPQFFTLAKGSLTGRPITVTQIRNLDDIEVVTKNWEPLTDMIHLRSRIETENRIQNIEKNKTMITKLKFEEEINHFDDFLGKVRTPRLIFSSNPIRYSSFHWSNALTLLVL
jgi:hypothetical protein